MRVIFVALAYVLLLGSAAYATVVELVPDSCCEDSDIFVPSRAEHELFWDDGSHCGYYHGSPDYRATTFTAPYNCKVTAIKIKWYGDAGIIRTAEFDIYCDDGDEPGTGLLSAHFTDNFYSAC
ncbi:MAG: hypothetical protein JSW52_03460 [Candidatus Coatesbacteria bacterium]|nr:MAG: hypothetical protein JSW52_03460 [Candidatus Coatesbacteria bacterium]